MRRSERTVTELSEELRMPDERDVVDETQHEPQPADDAAMLLRVVGALKEVPANDRVRCVQAAMIFLGTPISGSSAAGRTAERELPADAVDTHSSQPSLPRRVTIWMSQNAVNEGMLERAFHFSPSGLEVIAHTLPGKSNRERTRSCYLLAGLQSFLGSGEPRFTDESARAICRDLGCYDAPNHATYVKSLGNLVAGSKASAFELTQPGLKAAAELIRDLQSMVG
jgi:hypothetical protein